MPVHVSTQTLALLALLFSVTSQAINLTSLVRKIAAARLRRLERKLGLLHAQAADPEPTTITVDDIVEIKLRARPK